MVSKYDSAVSALLRTPGLFIIDYWWRLEQQPYIIGAKLDAWASFLVNLALVNGFLLLLLPKSCIRSLYTHIVCGLLLIVSHFTSYYFVNVTVLNVSEPVSSASCYHGDSQANHFDRR